MLPTLFLVPLVSALAVAAQENSTTAYLRLHRFERSLTPSLGGLLFKKQTCSSGWGPCLEPEGQCCPLDGVCCTTDGKRHYFHSYCMDPQYLIVFRCRRRMLRLRVSNSHGIEEGIAIKYMYFSGSEYCDVVDGIPGCCETGKICTLPPAGGGDTSIPVFTSSAQITHSVPAFSSSQNVLPTSSIVVGGGSGSNGGGIQTTAFGGGATTPVAANTNTADNSNALPTGLVKSSATRNLFVGNAVVTFLVGLVASMVFL